MTSSSLEITEKEYCIKLSRETFDLSLVRQLIKRIQAETLFFSPSFIDDDIVSRGKEQDVRPFDHLDDK